MSESKIELRSQRFRVVMGDPDLPDTWAEFSVQSLSRDQQIAEQLLHREMKVQNVTGATYTFADMIAFVAAKRTGLIDPTATWAQFNASMLEVTTIDELVSRPTVPAPDAG